ncbi:MAG TPA: hypothetical protein VIP11_07930, partial [Gemmatimonadaceae bacterium]
MPFLTVAMPATARSQMRLDLGGFLQVGGEGERYLRVLEISGWVPHTPWSIQPFSPTQALKLRPNKPHPWSARFDGQDGAATAEGLHVLRPKGRVVVNSAFPFQDGGGPTWAGRGFTGELQGGIGGSWKSVWAQLAPLAFVAQNSSFPLAPNGRTGDEQFADPRFPVNIDAPQRFGSKPYKRIAPGESFLTLDEGHVMASVISAAQQWGPARDYPLVLGPNGGGFPSVIAGTSRPVDLWL